MGIRALISSRLFFLLFLALTALVEVNAQEAVTSPLRLHDGILQINTVMPRLPVLDPALFSRYQVWYCFATGNEKENLDWLQSFEGEFSRDALKTARGRIHLRLVDASGNSGGDYVFPYLVDNTIPPKPLVIGLTQGGIYQSAPKVEVSFPPDFTCDYRLVLVRGSATPKKAGIGSGQDVFYDSGWTGCVNPIPFPALENMEVHGYLGYRLSSPSGLSREESIALEFSVDTNPPRIDKVYLEPKPDSNLLVSVQETIELSKSTLIHVESSDANGFVLQWDDQSTALEIPNPNNGIKIAVEEKRDNNRTLWIQARDLAGNRSERKMLSFHLDGIPPDPPPFPEITRNLNSGKISFPVVRLNHVYYQILSDPDAQVEYLEAKGTIDWTIPDTVQGLILRYESRDAAGNRTPGDSIFLPYIKVAKKPELNIPEGESYWPQEIQVKALESQDTIRYSIAGDKETLKGIDRNSPALGSAGMVLEAPPGEERTYRLRFKRYSEGSEASADFEARVHIDRTIPKEPDLAGYFPVNYLNQGLELVFRPMADETVNYRIDSCAADPVGLDDTSLLKDWQAVVQEKTYDQAITLDAPDTKNNVVYRLLAWTRDKAGNMSQRRSWIFVFEPSTLYVDASVAIPEDQQSGTRTHPYSGLVPALERVKEGPGTIILASGNYSVPRTITLDRNLKISGQRDPATWRATKGLVTVLYPARNFDGQWMFDVKDASLSLSSLYVSDAGKSLAGFIHSSQSALILENSQIAVTRSNSALAISGGSLMVNDSLISMSDPKAVRLIQLEKAKGVFRSCQIESSNLPDTLARNGSIGEYTLVFATESELEFQNTVLSLCRGYSAMGVDIVGGTLKADVLKINELKGASYATLVRAQGGADLNMNDCQLTMGGESGFGTAMQIIDSGLTLAASRISLSVRKSALGFKTYRSRLVIENSELAMEGAQDFLGLFKLEDSNLSVSGSKLGMGKSASLSIVSAQDSGTEWKENTVLFSASGKSSAFQFFGNGRQFFSRNLISGDQISVMMTMDSGTLLEMRGNILESWFGLLGFNPSGAPGKETLVRNLKELEALKGDSIFEGNRVRQGL